jgi:putative ABC transport system ATP-binding protein
MYAIMGPSGAGKSTLLELAAGLSTPDGGRVSIDGIDLATLSIDERADLRRRKIGVVFQAFNLLPFLSAFDNMALPLRLDSLAWSETERRVTAALERVGLSVRATHKPAELSGGEMQRVAIARALVIEPVVLLADEPTGNLDSNAGRQIMDLLREVNASTGVTIVVVTHDATWASLCDRIVRIVDGRIPDTRA